MKKLVLALLCALIAVCTAGLVACGADDTVNEIVFKTLTVNEKEISATVSNATDSFDFSQEIEKKGKADFILSTDAAASSVIENKAANLSVGENVFYVTLTVDGEKTETVYTLKIKRLAMYTVTFDTDGGTAVEAQTVEEGSLATAPTTTKLCYDFAGWDYDFTKPITANKTITASWTEKADIAAFTFETVGETCKITGLKESAVEITEIAIPDYVTAIDEEAFKNNTNIESVTIGASVTAIGNYAFSGCTGLNGTLSIPEHVIIVGKGAFQNCSGIDEIVIADGVGEIGENAFYNCSGVTDVQVGAGVIGEYAFSDCTGIESLNISATVSEIQYYAFGECESLSEVLIAEGVQTIGESAFAFCSSLTGISFPKSVVSMGKSALAFCDKLEEITIPFVGSEIKEETDTYQYPLGYIFGDANGWGADLVGVIQSYYGEDLQTPVSKTYYFPAALKTVTVAGGNILFGAFDSVTLLTTVYIADGVEKIISESFKDCSELTEITVSSSVTSVGARAFDNCAKLATLNWNAKNCTVPEGMGARIYYNCTKLATVNFGASVDTIPAWLLYATNTIKTVNIADGVKHIGSYAFGNCNGLETLTLGNTVETIDERAFFSCSQVATMVIPSSVQVLGAYAFASCSALTDIDLNNVVTVGENAFKDCTSLANVDLGANLTAISNGMFKDCTALNSIDLSSVSEIGNEAFVNCSFYSMWLPNSVVTIGAQAFKDCVVMEEVGLPIGIESIGAAAFTGCNSLTSVYYEGTIDQWCGIEFKGTANSIFARSSVRLYVNGDEFVSETVSINADKIGANAFAGYGKITAIDFGNKVKEIGAYAFYNCDGLSYGLMNAFILPSTLTIIGDSAFENCDGLQSVTVKSVERIGKAAFKDCPLIRLIVPFVGETEDGEENTYFGYIFGGDTYFDNATCIPTTLSMVDVTGGSRISASAFEGCSSIMDIGLPETLTTIGARAFLNCANLINIILPAGLSEIGNSAFSFCNNVENVSYGGTLDDWCGIEFKGYASSNPIAMSKKFDVVSLFVNGNELVSEEISLNAVKINSRAFAGYRKITAVSFGNAVTEIDDMAFMDCINITTLLFGTSVERIGVAAFGSCNKIISIMALPFVGETRNGGENSHFGYIFGALNYEQNADWVPTTLTTIYGIRGGVIAEHAFDSCAKITTITYANVTEIGNEAFIGCTALNEFSFNQTSGYLLLSDSAGSSWTSYIILSTFSAQDAASGLKDTFVDMYWTYSENIPE